MILLHTSQPKSMKIRETAAGGGGYILAITATETFVTRCSRFNPMRLRKHSVSECIRFHHLSHFPDDGSCSHTPAPIPLYVLTLREHFTKRRSCVITSA